MEALLRQLDPTRFSILNDNRKASEDFIPFAKVIMFSENLVLTEIEKEILHTLSHDYSCACVSLATGN